MKINSYETNFVYEMKGTLGRYKRPTTDFKIIGLPITVGRVLRAVENKGKHIELLVGDGAHSLVVRNFSAEGGYKIAWKFTKKEDGSECTDDDQADQTIEALLKLLK